MNSKFRIEALDFSHSKELSKVAEQTFLESHGHSASATDIRKYINSKLNSDVFEEELKNTENQFYGLYLDNRLIGYSKIICNIGYKEKIPNKSTKMERLYVLKEFYDNKLGKELLLFNIDLAKKNQQLGIWLYTWVENHRAIAFYKNFGFQIIDAADFKISENHSNPNHIMYLKF